MENIMLLVLGIFISILGIVNIQGNSCYRDFFCYSICFNILE